MPYAQLLNCVRLFATTWTVTYQAPLSMGFSRQEHWSGLPCPPPGHLPNPGIKARSPKLQADSLPAKPAGKLNRDLVSFYVRWGMNIPVSMMLYLHVWYRGISDFLKAHFTPFGFYERRTLVPVFANWKKSELDFSFYPKKS